MKSRILFVTTGLGTGGAEMMLYKILARLPGRSFAPQVLSLMDLGTYGARLEARGVAVHCLDLKGPSLSLGALRKVRSIARATAPHAIQGWMYHGNLVASLARSVAGRGVPLFHGIRQCVYRLGDEKPMTQLVIRAGARLSRGTESIVYVSALARRQHEALGYPVARGKVIENGFDPEEFVRLPDPARELRAELGISPDALVVGHIGRFHPVKDHRTLLETIAQCARAREDVHAILVGAGVDGSNTSLAGLARSLRIQERVHLLGERPDVARCLSAMDLFCLPSRSEGFPNVVGEAMLCELPCVVTDVGASPEIVGDLGAVVPVGDSSAAAAAVLRLGAAGANGLRSLGARCRQRVIERFGIESVVERYAEMYGAALSRCGGTS